MVRRTLLFVLPLVVAVAVAGIAYSASGSTMANAQEAGWDCNPQVLIVGYYHCAPPGKPSVQDMIDGDTSAPSIVLRVFNPDGSFAGTEMLRRVDLYRGQACPQDGLATWDLLPFGYYACHHFETG